MQTVAIVGAGLFGRLLALELARSVGPARYQVSLYERDSLAAQRSAGYAAAAMLAPLAEAGTADRLIVRLGLASLEQWSVLLEKLPRKVFFQRQGSLIVAHPQDHGDYLNFIHHLQHNLNDSDIADYMRPCDVRQLRTLEPEIGEQFQQGMYLRGEGQLDNRTLYSVSEEAIKNSNIGCFTHTLVEHIEGGYVMAQQHRKQFDWVIDCRGLGAKPDLPQLRGVRGEVIRLYAPEVSLQRPIRLMHPRYPLYIVPKPQHQYVIGATEIESDDPSPISVRSTLELLSAAYSLHSGFAEARILETLASCRPALPHNQPRINLGEKNIQVNGLYRHGYLITPTLIEEVIATLNSRCPSERQRNSRFPELYQPMLP